MVTNEEIRFQIEQRKQEIAMAQQELQNRQYNVPQQNVPQYNDPQPTIVQKALRMFNDLTKPRNRQRPQQGENNYSINHNRDDEINYFKKILQQKDIEIRKQRHMITKMNAPKTYIKRDFMKTRNIVKKKTVPRVVLRTSTSEPREAWLK